MSSLLNTLKLQPRSWRTTQQPAEFCNPHIRWLCRLPCRSLKEVVAERRSHVERARFIQGQLSQDAPGLFCLGIWPGLERRGSGRLDHHHAGPYAAPTAIMCRYKWVRYIHKYVYIYIYIHMIIYMHIYIYVYVYIYMHTYLHTYIHTYIHTYLHTDRHTYKCTVYMYAYTHICTYI